MRGLEVTGNLCSTVMSGDDAVRCKVAFDMCVQCVPTIVQTSLAFCGKPYLAQTVIILPLSSDGDRADMMITAHSIHAIGVEKEFVSPAARQGGKR